MFSLARATQFLVAVVLVALNYSNSLAGGFMIPHQTARGVGLANAITAGVKDASAVYYNPAALGDVDGNNVLVTGEYINVINSVENSGRKSVNQHDDNFLATLFANYHIPGTDFTAGIGTYAPFGLATTYDKYFTNFAAERTELKTIYVTPAISWHPSKYFAVGTGLSFVHASGVFSRALCLDPFTGCVTPGDPLEGRLRLTDTANAFAYNLGILIKPTDNLKFGLSYRSRVDLRFDNADVKFGGAFSPSKTKADVSPLPLPPVINAGLFWQITPNWGAEFVYEYTHWQEFKTFSATFSPTPLLLGVIPVPAFSLPERWKNTSVFRLGSYYALNRTWELRAGMTLDETPIPSRTLNPAIPGADLLTLNGGLGYKWRKVSVDIGYMAVFYKGRTVKNNELEGLPATKIPFLGAPGKDKYRTFHHFVAFSVNYRF
jgi:long-chain fatty acid transport protein